MALTTDGSKMLAADNDGKVYIKSGDGPWVETMPLTDLPESGPPTTASMSSDGSTVLARARDGRLYQYVNENWVALVSPQNTSGFCRFLALSPDGSKILAEFDNRLYLYGGIAWAEVRPAGDVDRNWSSVALTADGSKMLAASYGGLYLYDNGTWSEAQPAPGGPYEWIGAISADGSRIVAAASYGLYTYHGGAWTGIWVAGYSGTIWRSLTLSPDGSKFLVALDQRIYLGSEQEFETPLSNGVALTDTISQSHVRGTWKYYYVDLPEGVTDFVINLTGLTGDADLYVRWGDRSYSNNYDCVSWRDGSSNEQCYLMSPRPGRWYIMITNADPGTINYTLEATWVTNGPFTISGVVRNSSTREPIAGATVGVMDSNSQTVSTTTDDLGRFSQTIPIYEPGLYRVFAQALYYTSGPPAEVQVDSSHPTTSVTIELQPRNDLHVINLSPGWNFVSTPRQLQPPANLMENVMAGIASSLDIIWTYNSATRAWLVYRPSGS
ncbi:MAG: carboxypeptidase regulatory-like domain-containing protein, partial [Chitinivibrionia bacterium]|nr:carboxypeptidase regulatory-like domain-containing protein [Chitinivibrionia bacterium]